MNWLTAADDEVVVDEESYNILAAPIAEFVHAPVIAAVPCFVPSANRPDKQLQLITPELKASIIPIPIAALLEIGRNNSFFVFFSSDFVVVVVVPIVSEGEGNIVPLLGLNEASSDGLDDELTDGTVDGTLLPLTSWT
jgi:hypothetical protein